jgi:hypothetical protein
MPSPSLGSRAVRRSPISITGRPFLPVQLRLSFYLVEEAVIFTLQRGRRYRIGWGLLSIATSAKAASRRIVEDAFDGRAATSEFRFELPRLAARCNSAFNRFSELAPNPDNECEIPMR